MTRKLPKMTSVTQLIALAERGAKYRYWYQDAADALEPIAAELGVTYRQLAAAYACASPRTQVVRHLPIAIGLITGNYASGTMRMHKGLWASYQKNAIPLATQKRYSKVERFTQALWGYANAIPIDVWMAVAMGLEEDTALKRIRVIEAVTDRVRLTAAMLQWPARETQAAIWGATYEIHTNRRAPPAVVTPVDTRQKRLFA